MGRILVRFGNGLEIRIALRAETPSVRALLKSLPFKSSVHRWGDEIYFASPFHSGREGDSRIEMNVGEVAFWPDGDAVALFFGPTPASTDENPRAYSPCNILGRVDGSLESLKTVSEGMSVEVLKA
jgi:hypothetical protein